MGIVIDEDEIDPQGALDLMQDEMAYADVAIASGLGARAVEHLEEIRSLAADAILKLRVQGAES
jgi:hypothetical protein